MYLPRKNTPKPRRLSRRQRHKQEVGRRLQEHDLSGLRVLARKTRLTLPTLVSYLLETNDLLRWRAIHALGLVAADMARSSEGLARVRDLVRRQLWSMNDESGGVGWHSPEAVGEILVNVPPLAEEFATILASYADISPYEEGVFRALHHLAGQMPRLVADQVPRLSLALESQDSAISGHAMATLALLGHRSCSARADRALDALATPVVLYDRQQGELYSTPLGQLVRQAQATMTVGNHKGEVG